MSKRCTIFGDDDMGECTPQANCLNIPLEAEMKAKAMSTDNLFEIAKVIDNEYIGKEKTFTATRKLGYWYLTTNVCDWACFIKVYETNNKVSTVEVMGEYTDGWQPVTVATWAKLALLFKEFNQLPSPPKTNQ